MSVARIWKWATTTPIGALVLIVAAAMLGLLLRQMFGKGFTDGLGWLIGFVALSFYTSHVSGEISDLRQENESLRGDLRGLEQRLNFLREDMEQDA